MPIRQALAGSFRTKNSTMQGKIKKILLRVGAILFWLGLWQIAATIVNKDLLIKIPTPLTTLSEFFVCVGEPQFWGAVINSMWHIVLGFALAAVLGLIFGMLSGNSRFFKTLFSPITHLIRAVPVAAFIFLAFIWMRSSVIPSFISFLMVFPIIWTQVEAGLYSVDNRLIEMARVMGMDTRGIIKHIKIPAVLPYFRTSCITGLGFAWKSGVAAEVICNPTGSIGALLSGAKSNIEYTRVFALVLTIVILSLILENIIKFFWRESRYDKI